MAIGENQVLYFQCLCIAPNSYNSVGTIDFPYRLKVSSISLIPPYINDSS
jgi:hypothetical protein